MKRVLITLIAVFYLGVASGATVHFHYCMGQLINWGLETSKSESCGKCGMEKSDADNCCKDQHKDIKVDRAHQSTSNIFHFDQGFPGLLSPAQALNFRSKSIPSLTSDHPIANSPPVGNIPIFVRDCSFLI